MSGKKLLALDAVMLVVYVFAANPTVTGIPVHEWLGLAVLLVLLVHVAAHFDWLLATLRGKRTGERTARDVLALGATDSTPRHPERSEAQPSEVEGSRAATAGKRTARNVAKLALDILLALALAACCVSGLMVSATVLPALGLYATGYYFWDPLHAVSAKLLLALLLVHVALNWKLVVAALGNAARGKKR